MTEPEVRKILKNYIDEDNNLGSDSEYMNWYLSDKKITLDGRFTLEELEAIVWWMKNKKRDEE